MQKDSDGTPFVTEEEELRRTRGQRRKLVERVQQLKECAINGHQDDGPDENGLTVCPLCDSIVSVRGGS